MEYLIIFLYFACLSFQHILLPNSIHQLGWFKSSHNITYDRTYIIACRKISILISIPVCLSVCHRHRLFLIFINDLLNNMRYYVCLFADRIYSLQDCLTLQEDHTSLCLTNEIQCGQMSLYESDSASTSQTNTL